MMTTDDGPRPMCYNSVHMRYVDTLMHFGTVQFFCIVSNKFTMQISNYELQELQERVKL